MVIYRAKQTGGVSKGHSRGAHPLAAVGRHEVPRCLGPRGKRAHRWRSLDPCPEVDSSYLGAVDRLGRLKVLLVTNMYPYRDNPAWGVFVKQQADGLRRLGHHVDVLHIQGRRSKCSYLTAAFAVLRMTLRGSYDIVHAHYGLSGIPASFCRNVPLVVTLHGSDVLGRRHVRVVSRIACFLADASISVSEEIAAVVVGEIIPCGVDLELFKPCDQRESRIKLGLPPHPKLVLFPFDRCLPHKRYDLAKDAVSKLASQGYPCRLLHVYGVKHEVMPSYYNAVDAMLLCSDHEGSPVSLKEALACNTPVVSTDVGDVREILQGIEGTRICGPTVGALVEALKAVLWADTNGGFSGRLAMQRYSHERTLARILNVYRRVLRERQQLYAGKCAAT